MHIKSNKYNEHKTDVATMKLRGADKKAFVSAFSSPTAPSKYMEKALSEYKELKKVDTAAPSDFAKMVDEKLNTKGDKK